VVRAVDRAARLAVIAGASGCLVAAAVHGIPLLLPIVIGGAVGLVVRWLPLAVRALVRRNRIE